MGERTFVDRNGNVWSVWERPSRIEMDKDSGDDLQQTPPAQGITFENEETDEVLERSIKRPLADATDQDLQIALDRSRKARG